MNKTIRQNFSKPEEARMWAQFIAFSPFVFQAAKCLRNFGILEQLCNKQGTSFAELQEAAQLSNYALGVLLDAGDSCGLLYQENSLYFITPAGECIARDPLTQVNMNFADDVCYKGLSELQSSLQSGRPEGLREFGQWPTIYEGLTQLPERALKSWLEFDHYFSDDAFPKAIAILLKDSPKRILDIGGNTGKFAMACAGKDPQLSVTILDHPAQLELASKAINEKGFKEQVQFVPMNLLDHSKEFPKEFDAIWMSQFLDCFGKEDIVQLLSRARRAMSEQTRLFIMEPFVDRQKYEAGRFCLDMTSLYFTCMANGNSRMYRASDFKELLAMAELEIEEEYNLRLSQTILKCRLAKQSKI